MNFDYIVMRMTWPATEVLIRMRTMLEPLGWKLLMPETGLVSLYTEDGMDRLLLTVGDLEARLSAQGIISFQWWYSSGADLFSHVSKCTDGWTVRFHLDGFSESEQVSFVRDLYRYATSGGSDFFEFLVYDRLPTDESILSEWSGVTLDNVMDQPWICGVDLLLVRDANNILRTVVASELGAEALKN